MSNWIARPFDPRLHFSLCSIYSERMVVW